MRVPLQPIAVRALVLLCATVWLVAIPLRAQAAPADSPLCAWRFMSNDQVLNVAFPDSNATYWVLPYALGSGDRIELSGDYPAARYFSLNTYGTNFDTVDTLRDNQIVADPGSVNPFVIGSATNESLQQRHWHATLVTGHADRTRNEIQALPAEQNTPVGFLIIRVYVPTDPRSLNGGVGLPTATMHVAGATVQSQPCNQVFDPQSYSGPVAAVGADAFDRVIGNAAAGAFPGNVPEATFVNPASTSGLFPNGDNRYIGAGLTYQPGRLVVIRAKAPSYPDTRAGQAPTSPTQVRYWSMCQNDQVSPYPVVGCAADFQTRLDGDGYYTYVVAAPQDLPATIGPGVTVLPWGSTAVAKKVVFLRYMLPSSQFYPNSIQASQAQRSDPAVTMGAYYPHATYCDKATFASGGATACFR
ncbi:hypothetical protein FOS14_10245 [Skermania sp. ID1734]|uniref:hypothetical protein n=1 Tax=Skermania sp. ID1734 TaxID=2597516 RepID=UPI00117D7536|nr:hypothetical protein [Skermania sp. ID1734]TSD99650.1 hypothetical protein FOS14_10245 [Skermania sp. ID1734]